MTIAKNVGDSKLLTGQAAMCSMRSVLKASLLADGIGRSVKDEMSVDCVDRLATLTAEAKAGSSCCNLGAFLPLE